MAELVVTTISDVVNGDVPSVAGLVENPGADGISLREAIEATNNDPGTYTIRFAPGLRGRTITLRGELPLAGGGVTLEGTGVTLRAARKDSGGLLIGSSGNRVRGLTLAGFDVAVLV